MEAKARRKKVEALKRVTLVDIAEGAGVSVGLVSAFLSGRNYGRGPGSGIRIGEETAKRLVNICREMGYQPNRLSTYAMIYPERAPVGIVGSKYDQFQSNRYYSMILDGVMTEVTAQSLNLVILQYDPGMDYAAYPEELPEWVVNGELRRFIFAGPPNLSLLRVLLEQKADIVYASREPGLEGVSATVPDYGEAACLAIRHLHRLGHRTIGFFGLPHFHGTYQAEKFLKGGLRLVEELNIGHECFLEPATRARTDFADLALDRFLNRTPPVTAVFAFDDLSAESVIATARRRGLCIPRDLSVIGCNDERQAAFVDPPLTTIHFPISDIGRTAIHILQRRTSQWDLLPVVAEVLPVSLVQRSSDASPGVAPRG